MDNCSMNKIVRTCRYSCILCGIVPLQYNSSVSKIFTVMPPLGTGTFSGTCAVLELVPALIYLKDFNSHCMFPHQCDK